MLAKVMKLTAIVIYSILPTLLSMLDVVGCGCGCGCGWMWSHFL